jgi:asparagine synthase (glutamine-hydrolysing)
MCGLTGFWNFRGQASKETLLTTVESMALAIQKRGPDSFGVWADEKEQLAFGHRRLAIVDLSEAGHQPMFSHSGRWVIIYNGEIYNTDELRKELIDEGCQFRSHSDTEVIVEACERWGVEKTCTRLIGMFAFACWEVQEKRLFLARDRLGIKPLYWGFHQGIFFFGSQLKSFSSHPVWQPVLNKKALCAYFRFNYVPAPLSIFEGIQKLSPGVILSIDKSKNISQTQFWDLKKVVALGRKNRLVQPDVTLIDELDNLLSDAVKRRMVADVPLGAFLSGGIDSSIVVALMQKNSLQPIKTFSIGFHEDAYNEAQYAAKVAQYLKTDHHELYLTAKDAIDIIPSIPDWCDEPFADVSQIPTFLVSKLARQQVTISLSGDGGDELFAGYHRYFWGQKIWQKIKHFPFWLRCLSAGAIQQFPPNTWDAMSHFMPKKLNVPLLGDKAHKLATILRSPDEYAFYQSLVSQWEQPAKLVLGSEEPILSPWDSGQFSNNPQSFVETMQMMDMLTYLPDDILAKIDRASMAVGLEARVPLLDHRVVELSWQLPLDVKIRQGQGKWILRQVLNRYVPQDLVGRPKMGFGVPIGEWLRGPLREWATHLLSSQQLKADGILNENLVRKKWEEHISGKRNWQYPLWGVLMFQAWKGRWYRS